MAGDEVTSRRIGDRRKHGDTDKTKSRKPGDNRVTKVSSATAERPSDLDALREARLAYIAKPPEEKRKEMKYGYVKTTKSQSQIGERPEKRRDESKSQKRPMRRTDTTRTPRDEQDNDFVYSRVERQKETNTTPGAAPPQTRTKTQISSSSKADAQRKAPERRHTEPARRKIIYTFNEEPEQCPQEVSSPTPRRASTVVGKTGRPDLTRSATTRTKTEVSVARTDATTTTPSKRKSTLLGVLLPPKPATPQKLVSCLTCGADDVPASKAALLPCKHRMCNSCLKRIFTMSVKDPAHMPPRCCTDQHIDLKHVEKLFDDKFKILWNRKFMEYKTKNRIYCPAPGCGAWIKPHYVSVENGRKVAKCKRCKTKVCPTCSQKMHTKRECPKDPETKAFIEAAKQKGWQRCYSCHAMVELKEGCNHMTCRCTAEFCMVCGMKWKSCDCPWFNYEAVDAHLGNPIRYQEELDRRRDQVNRDEELARRLQQLGGAGGVFGVGNGANHQMNQNFIQQAREALTANYAQANQAARDLLNGFVMGRENRLPGLPQEMGQMIQGLAPGRNQQIDPAEGNDAAVRPRRRGTTRRRGAAQDEIIPGAPLARNHERRIQDWANDIG